MYKTKLLIFGFLFLFYFQGAAQDGSSLLGLHNLSLDIVSGDSIINESPPVITDWKSDREELYLEFRTSHPFKVISTYEYKPDYELGNKYLLTFYENEGERKSEIALSKREVKIQEVYSNYLKEEISSYFFRISLE